MKDRLLGCLTLLFIGALIFAWWLPKTHTAFWLILIGGLALWIGGIYLSVRFTRPDTTLGSARFGSRADGAMFLKSRGRKGHGAADGDGSGAGEEHGGAAAS